MIVYAVISLAPNPQLAAAISAKFPNNAFSLSDSAWLVAGSGTAQEISHQIGITAPNGQSGPSIGPQGNAIVFPTAGYFGWAPSNVWEWIVAKREAPANG